MTFDYLALHCDNVCIFIQEIKFVPNVMCEPIDKKLTFRASQVCVLHSDHQ